MPKLRTCSMIHQEYWRGFNLSFLFCGLCTKMSTLGGTLLQRCPRAARRAVWMLNALFGSCSWATLAHGLDVLLWLLVRLWVQFVFPVVWSVHKRWNTRASHIEEEYESCSYGGLSQTSARRTRIKKLSKKQRNEFDDRRAGGHAHHCFLRHTTATSHETTYCMPYPSASNSLGWRVALWSGNMRFPFSPNYRTQFPCLTEACKFQWIPVVSNMGTFIIFPRMWDLLDFAMFWAPPNSEFEDRKSSTPQH